LRRPQRCPRRALLLVEPAMKACIRITLKHGVLDPQGKAIENALASLGFTGVREVRQGKYIEVDLAETDAEKAREQVDRICRDLLANTVIEKYAFELVP
jgi:phosphoribosylformylglycinamidine synthase